MAEQSLPDWEAEIDRRLEDTLASDSDARIPIARDAVTDCEDRWFGQLVVRSYADAADSVDPESILPAATTIELLRGYCRLRNELLAQVADDVAHSLTRDPTAALLAGDFLFSAAFTELRELEVVPTETCYEVLTDVSRSLVEAFASQYDEPMSPADRYCALIDDSIGALGSGAAVIGASAADIDPTQHDHFAAVGRSLSVSRQIRETIGRDVQSAHVDVPELDEKRLRAHARQQLSEAEQALQMLSADIEMSRIRPLFDELDGVSW